YLVCFGEPGHLVLDQSRHRDAHRRRLFHFPVDATAFASDGRTFFAAERAPDDCFGHADSVHCALQSSAGRGGSIHHLSWFYPACMIVVGTHYLPFIFLYGMRQFGALAGILISAGLVIGLYLPSSSFSFGGWLTAVTLLAFAFLERRTALKERADLAASPRQPLVPD